MAIFDWDPFEELTHMQSEMDRLFRNLSGGKPLLEGKGIKGKEVVPWHNFRMPVADMYETDKSIVAEIELPGVDKKD